MKTEFASVYFNSTTKTIINSKYMLDKSFQEILYRIDNWINEGSGWVIESIHAEYLNISIYSPLSASLTLNCLINENPQWKVWLILKTMTINVFFGVISNI